MSRFREFLIEVGALKRPFAGGTQYSGYFQLPDLRNIHKPGELPMQGIKSLAQGIQMSTDRQRYGYTDLYIIRDTLEKLRALAENVMSAIQLRQGLSGFIGRGENNYNTATYDQATQTIHGLTTNEITGGTYPRLRNEEVARGRQMRIVQPDPQNPSLWSLNIAMLRDEMVKMQHKLHGEERHYQAMQHLAGAADRTIDTIGQHMMTPNANMRGFNQG